MKTPDSDPATLFMPVTNYALRPLPNAFKNFEETIRPLLEPFVDVKEFDITAFYSRRREGLSPEAEAELGIENDNSYSAALSAGGLVVYYQGALLEVDDNAKVDPELDLDFTPNCLSFCVWASRKQAIRGAQAKSHQNAIIKVDEWYEKFLPKKYAIKVHKADKPDLQNTSDIVLSEVKPVNL